MVLPSDWKYNPDALMSIVGVPGLPFGLCASPPLRGQDRREPVPTSKSTCRRGPPPLSGSPIQVLQLKKRTEVLTNTRTLIIGLVCLSHLRRFPVNLKTDEKFLIGPLCSTFWLSPVCRRRGRRGRPTTPPSYLRDPRDGRIPRVPRFSGTLNDPRLW